MISEGIELEMAYDQATIPRVVFAINAAMMWRYLDFIV